MVQKKHMINAVDFSFLLRYVVTQDSLFRRNQYAFLQLARKYIQGSLVEIGAEPQYNHASYFPDVKYIGTNIKESEGLTYLDVANIDRPDDSVDNYLCVSVLEHVPDLFSAAKELNRTLRPSGYLILTIPFAYPVHDTVDYWRLAPDAFCHLFNDFELVELYHFGGKFSTCAEVLQRPRGKLKTKRHLVSKFVGWVCLLLSYFFEVQDGFPQGYGFVLKKKQA